MRRPMVITRSGQGGSSGSQRARSRWWSEGTTGGLAVANRNDAGEGVSRILSGSRAYYLVGYEPDRSTFGGERPRFHSLEVRVKRPGLKVRSRKGFFGVSDDELLTLATPGALPDPPR